MFLTLLLPAALCVPPADASVSAREMELAVRVTATRLIAFNPTDRPEFVLLENRERGHRATLIVPPHARLDLRFPAQALEGLVMTIAARTGAGVVLSERWSVEELSRTTHGFVWFDAGRGHSHAWMETPRGFELITREARSECSASHSMCAPPAAHVPVITPYDGRAGDLPPRLEHDPLPPV